MHYAGLSPAAEQVWHITQRCYQQQFLLADEVERRRWVYCLYQARRLYGLSVLNYVVTSNHVHLLVQDHGRFSLRASLSAINARTTREFNARSGRRAPFWESDHQITAVQTNAHLARCMTYIDMNMVRAGEVTHPDQWRCSGYYESMNPCRRAARIDHAGLRSLLGFSDDETFRAARIRWVQNKLQEPDQRRESYWSDSLAVGDLGFALKMKRAFAYAYPGRRAQREAGCFAVREQDAPLVS